jgi:hypothetical protein
VPDAISRRIDWAAWRSAVLAATGMYAVFRVISELVALVGQYGVQFPHVVARDHSALLLPWDRFDTQWFETLARTGYGHLGVHGFRPEVFGPVLPALMKGVSAALHLSLLSAGLLVTNVALVAALAVLHRLVAEDHGRGVALTTLTLLLVWPASFFLGAAYTEPLELLWCAGAFLAARRQRWLLCGVLAALAALTKFYFVIVVVALVVERLDRGGLRASRRRLARDLALLLAPVALAWGGWMAYMQRLFGDPLAFVHAQASFGHGFAWPWSLAHKVIGDLANLRFLDTSVASAVEPFDALAVVVIGVFAVYAFLHLRRSYAVWLGLAFCVYVFQGILVSEVRETLILFPVFLGMALLVQRRVWLERLVTVAALPSGIFLLGRFVTDKFAG